MADVSPDVASTTAHKLATAKQKKDTGDEAFKQGKVKDALKSYHEALMYLLGLDKNALQSLGVGPKSSSVVDDAAGSKEKERTEADDILEKIYANMSACHLKNQNYKRAVETADKVGREGIGRTGLFEKAVKILEDLKTKNPTDATIVAQEIARLRAIDDERERVHKKKMKGFLNKAEKKGNALFDEPESTTVKPGFIEEVTD
ncbi:hypothetical protein BDZ97DRAFT_1922854 [Flammula alnicola]|nr:hypothetical protein BDZ97DRAFT_1922854 [Flammula alnicola]